MQKSYASFSLVSCLAPTGGWCHIYYATIVSNLRLHDFLRTVWCTRQNKMTSAKGSTYFQNLRYKCYKIYIYIFYVAILLQINQILNKLERVFQWLHPTFTYLTSKTTNFNRVPKLTSCHFFRQVSIQNFFRLRFF